MSQTRSFYKQLKHKFTESYTLVSWFSFSSRVLNGIIIIPILFSYYEIEDIYYLFITQTILSLAILFDWGLRSTGTRFIAYKSSKKTSNNLDNIDIIKNESLQKIFKYFCTIYLIIAPLAIILIFTICNYFIGNKYEGVDNISILALFISFAFGVNTILSPYRVLMEGLNNVRIIKIYEGFINLFLFSVSLIAVKNRLDIIFIIFISTAYLMVPNIVCFLLKNKNKIRLKYQIGFKIDKLLIKIIKDSSKVALTNISTLGLIHFTALINTKYCTKAESTSYLLLLRIWSYIRDFTYSPFLNKIPMLSKIYGDGDIKKLNYEISRSKYQIVMIFLFFSIITIIFGEQIFKLINRDIIFSNTVCCLLTIGFLVSRMSAINIQSSHVMGEIISQKIDIPGGIVSGSLLLVSVFIYNTLNPIIITSINVFVNIAVYLPLSIMLSKNNTKTNVDLKLLLISTITITSLLFLI